MVCVGYLLKCLHTTFQVVRRFLKSCFGLIFLLHSAIRNFNCYFPFSIKSISCLFIKLYDYRINSVFSITTIIIPSRYLSRSVIFHETLKCLEVCALNIRNKKRQNKDNYSDYYNFFAS